MPVWLQIVSYAATALGGMLLQVMIYDVAQYGRQRALQRHIQRFRVGATARINALGLRRGDDPQLLFDYTWHGETVRFLGFASEDEASIELPAGMQATIPFSLLVPLEPAPPRRRRSVPRGTAPLG